MAYTLDQATYRNLKRRLTLWETRLRKARIAYGAATTRDERETARKAIVHAADGLQSAAGYGLFIFEERGYPDLWHRWERAREDAINDKRYYGERF